MVYSYKLDKKIKMEHSIHTLAIIFIQNPQFVQINLINKLASSEQSILKTKLWINNVYP